MQFLEDFSFVGSFLVDKSTFWRLKKGNLGLREFGGINSQKDALYSYLGSSSGSFRIVAPFTILIAHSVRNGPLRYCEVLPSHRVREPADNGLTHSPVVPGLRAHSPTSLLLPSLTLDCGVYRFLAEHRTEACRGWWRRFLYGIDPDPYLTVWLIG